MLRLLPIVAALALAPFATGQTVPTSFQTYGLGCAHPLNPNPPTLYSAKGPVLGQPFSWEVRNVPANTLGLMLIGGSNQFWGGTPLPLPLAFHDMPGCSLYCSPDVYFYLATGTGTAKATVGMPSQANLLKLTFYMQFLVPDAAANKQGVGSSNAAIAVIGNT